MSRRFRRDCQSTRKRNERIEIDVEAYKVTAVFTMDGKGMTSPVGCWPSKPTALSSPPPPPPRRPISPRHHLSPICIFVFSVKQPADDARGPSPSKRENVRTKSCSGSKAASFVLRRKSEACWGGGTRDVRYPATTTSAAIGIERKWARAW